MMANNGNIFTEIGEGMITTSSAVICGCRKGLLLFIPSQGRKYKSNVISHYKSIKCEVVLKKLSL